jgi:hypothetical protein
MATHKTRPNTGYYRRRRNVSDHNHHDSHSELLRWLIIFGCALILTLLVAAPAAKLSGF